MGPSFPISSLLHHSRFMSHVRTLVLEALSAEVCLYRCTMNTPSPENKHRAGRTVQVWSMTHKTK